MIFEKGQILCFTESDYSDYTLVGLVKTKTALDPDMIEAAYCETTGRQPWDNAEVFLEWLVANDYVERLEATEWWCARDRDQDARIHAVGS